MKHIAFILTMPNVGSWNGRWTGESNKYVRVRSYSNKHKITERGYPKNYYYNFGDGWGANVEAIEVDAKQGRKLTKESLGFYGYDWMIDSIEKHDKILNSIQEAAS